MKLQELPGLKFASADISEIDLEIVSAVETYLGRKLARADPLRLFLRGVEQIIQQQRLLIDQCAKQNLLAYAVGDNLEHLGALVGVGRLEPSAATATFELKLSAARDKAVAVSKGTRFTAGDDVYFALDSDHVFRAGETEATVHATCTELGEVGNNYLPGEINIIADPQPFLSSAVNVTKSEGGADLESDDALRERIHEAPERFSVAGPVGAYRAFSMSASALISDVSITSPEPGVVVLVPLLKGGAIPTDEILRAVYDACNARVVRPLTDELRVAAPEQVPYRLLVDYYISSANAAVAASIIDAAERVVKEYVMWQRSVLGRDITPTELIHRLHEVGVKRVVVHDPQFTVIKPNQIAVIEENGLEMKVYCEAYFAGLEDD